MRYMVATALAAVVSILLIPVLVFAGYLFMLLGAMVVVNAGWTDAGWWDPWGHHALGGLFIVAGLALIVVDVLVGAVLRRVLLGEVARRRRSASPISPAPRRAW